MTNGERERGVGDKNRMVTKAVVTGLRGGDFIDMYYRVFHGN